MKMVIAGGRDFEGRFNDTVNIRAAVTRYQITEIVSGGAPGADAFGEETAKLLGLKITIHPALWIKHGKKAGPIRNRKMAEYTDYVFLLPGGRGTASMRREAQKAGKKIIYDSGAWL
jgi:hypothetical protein